MNKILLIGKLNETVKDLNAFLSHYFHIQVANENAAVVEGMLKVVQPDAIIISLIGSYDIDSTIFVRIADTMPYTPVLTIGTLSEKERFLKFYDDGQFENLIRPIENRDVFKHLCRRLTLDMNEVMTGTVSDGRKHLLIVDDNAATLRALKNMLEDRYEIAVANSGMKAMTSIGRRRPDLILLDYEMPVCDGRQTLEMIRADEDLTTIPVIFLTGVNDRENIQAVLKLRPAGYLLKPPVREKLISSIEKALGED